MVYSFLLVNFNMWGLVERCVREIRAHVGPETSFEIIIADNSTDPRFAAPEPSAAAESEVGLRILRITENKGWVDGLNRILPLARGQFVVIMHPDVTLKEACLDRLRCFIETHPQVGVASPDLVYPDGSPNAIRLRFPQIRVEVRRLVNIVSHILFRRHPLRDEVFWDHQSDASADMVMSVMMMFRRETLLKIGAIDPKLWTYYANDWLCGRVRQLGWTCAYVASAQAIHWERHSPATLYSDATSSAYKRDPVPVSDRMCRDRFTFLKSFYSFPICVMFRLLVTLEFLIHTLAQLRPGRINRKQTVLKYTSTIKAAWAS
jgi:GT2 family glycosyltransferase